MLYEVSSMGQLRRYSDSLRVGRSWDRIPMVGRFSAPRPDRPWGSPNQYSEHPVSFPGVKNRGCRRVEISFLAFVVCSKTNFTFIQSEYI